MSNLLCEICGAPNDWSYIDRRYNFVCGECADQGCAEMCPETHVFRGLTQCSGVQCEKWGLPNYDIRNDGKGKFYCGSGPGCCP